LYYSVAVNWLQAHCQVPLSKIMFPFAVTLTYLKIADAQFFLKKCLY